jgi:hypothetical protein
MSEWTWEHRIVAEGGAPLLVASRRAFGAWRGEHGTLDHPERAMVSLHGTCTPDPLPLPLLRAPHGWTHPTAEVASWDDAGQLVASLVERMRASHPDLAMTGPGPSTVDRMAAEAIDEIARSRGEVAAAALRAKLPAHLREHTSFDGAAGQLVVERFVATDVRRGLNQLDRDADAGIVRFGDHLALLWRIAGAGGIEIGRDGDALLLVKVLFADDEADERTARDHAAAHAVDGDACCDLAIDDSELAIAWCPVSGTDLAGAGPDGELAGGAGQLLPVARGDYSVHVGAHRDDALGVRWCALVPAPRVAA